MFLSSILQLRKVCNHPSLLYGTSSGDQALQSLPKDLLEGVPLDEQSGKLAVVAHLLQEMREKATREKVIHRIA